MTDEQHVNDPDEDEDVGDESGLAVESAPEDDEPNEGPEGTPG